MSFGALKKDGLKKINYSVSIYPSYFKFSRDKLHLNCIYCDISTEHLRDCGLIYEVLFRYLGSVSSLCTFSGC